MIQVFIADDHAIFRHGLRKLLESQPNLKVVGEAGDGQQVLDAAEKAKWDLLVLDLSLPTVSGMEVMRRLKERFPALRIVILSMYPEDQYAVRLMSQGASAYVSKDRDPTEVVAAVQKVARGGTYLNPDVATQALNRPVEQGRAPHEMLSPREYQVFTLIFQGKTVSAIAIELNLSLSTISNHLRQVKDKLGAETVADIVSYAHRAGLVGGAR